MTTSSNSGLQINHRYTLLTFAAHLVVLVVFLSVWFSVVRSFHSLYERLHAADVPKQFADLMLRPTVVLTGTVVVLVIDGLVLYAFSRSRSFVSLRAVWNSLVFFIVPVGAIWMVCFYLSVAPIFSLPVVTVHQDAELKSIAGTYKLLRSERAGRVFESANPHEVLTIEDGGRHTFISWALNDVTAHGLLSLDLASPKRLSVRRSDTEYFGQTQHGLYRLEGDQLTICFSPLNTPLHMLPTTFATAGNENVLLVYQRTSLAGSD